MSFCITKLTPRQLEHILPLAGANWLPQAHFLVSYAPLVAGSAERRVIIVCDTPYTNVPQHRFFSAPPTHAAGFSDGTTGLITPTEFSALDRKSFVALDELYPAKKR